MFFLRRAVEIGSGGGDASGTGKGAQLVKYTPAQDGAVSISWGYDTGDYYSSAIRRLNGSSYTSF